MLEPAWHLVADDGQLANDGDFVTATLLGRPLQIRRFAGDGVDGGVVALSNVCGHRHCRLTGEAAGNSPTMRCGYHGWEYGRDGRTRRIPRPRDFAPFPGDRPRLPRYACERVGGLWFVRIAEDGPTLREHLGDLHGRLAERFAAPFTPTLRRTLDYAADWKVPVENTLEAYHVDAVHPHSFGSAPPEERCEHGFGPNRTWFATGLPFDSGLPNTVQYHRMENFVLRRLGVTPTMRYEQHHVFPNLLFSFTDALSLVQCVVPTADGAAGGNTCVGVVRQFGRVPADVNPAARWLARRWAAYSAGATAGVLGEDAGMFAEIQVGLDASPHDGLLGRCEERIHAFQEWLLDAAANDGAGG